MGMLVRSPPVWNGQINPVNLEPEVKQKNFLKVDWGSETLLEKKENRKPSAHVASVAQILSKASAGFKIQN